MPYPEQMVAPMRDELTRLGVKELRSPAEVDAFMADAAGVALLVINSVCGCAAGAARPGVALALSRADGPRPDRVATVFAGQDLDATTRARSYFADIPPSSPSAALLREGQVVAFVPRHAIEGRAPAEVARTLTEAFDKFCSSTPAAVAGK
ncbi:MAG: BrxA/BrxB family bacilliredoxin [Planctomycetes bacterium]|nr:BrxA/BrxB family bacilliredoxin [Planctomycetota bacterium]